jgi:hypothetical protein
MEGSLDNPPIIIRSSPAKLALVAFIGVGFLAVSAFAFTHPDGPRAFIAGCCAGVLGALGVLVAVAQIFKPTIVELSAQGLFIRTFRKTFHADWSDIARFRMCVINSNKLVAFDWRDDSPRRSGLSDVNRGLAGVDGALPSTLALPSGQVLDLAQAALARWGSPAEPEQ